MISGINYIKSALSFVCGENVHICRLCLCSTKSREIPITDGINVTKSYFDEIVSYKTVLNALEVSTDAGLPQVLCSNCAVTAVHCYLFQKLRIYSQEKWRECLNILENSVSQANDLNARVQTAYFVITKDDSVLLTSQKRLSARTKRFALGRVKENLKNRLKYLEDKQKVYSTVCEECGECFNSRWRLAKHISIKHSKTKFMCSKCPKIFSTVILLEAHTMRVHFPRNIPCNECPKLLSTEKHLRIHKQSHHTVVSCKMCGMKLPSRIELRAHIAKHNVNTCSTCKKKFVHKRSYQVHIEICGQRDKTPKFVCDICSKGYARKNNLRSHLIVDHEFGKVLSCNWCNKKFDAISKLKDHIVKHTRERKFTCEQCGGKFVTNAALIYHTRLHTGERPFKCDICDERFLSSSRRMAHIRRKHLEPSLECNVCNMKFVTSSELKKHKKRHFNPHSKLYMVGTNIKKQNVV